MESAIIAGHKGEVMPVFFLKDTRVHGAAPECDILIQATPSDDLRTVVQRLADRIATTYSEPGSYHSLHIMCHGTPQGLQLGTPYSTQFNARYLFSPLHGKVGTIEINSCAAAAIYNRGTPPRGPYDGAAFCSVLAITVAAMVIASDAAQGYLPSDSITSTSGRSQLANWQGNVGSWDAQGHLLRFTTPVQRNMSPEHAE